MKKYRVGFKFAAEPPKKHAFWLGTVEATSKPKAKEKAKAIALAKYKNRTVEHELVEELSDA